MKLLILLIPLTLVLPLAAYSEKSLVNTNFWGVALKGYDPVAFFAEGEAVKGSDDFTVDYEGATYKFSSDANRMTFLENPQKYLPAYGGYCAWAVSEKNSLAPVDIATWQIIEGRLFLNYNRSIKEKFNENVDAHIRKADQNWPGLVDKKAK